MSRAIGDKGKVIAFEAQPELKAYLYKIKNAFSLDNLEIVNSAVFQTWRNDIKREHVGSGSASLNFYDKDDNSKEDIPIKAITLDDFLASGEKNQLVLLNVMKVIQMFFMEQRNFN